MDRWTALPACTSGSRTVATPSVTGATAIETCILASNEDGLRFARAHGFTETDRYVLPGSTIPWVDLRRE
ncbi:hypothetical protein GA0115251_130015 [Streptomyces sp. TverLS-915]|nr:hypothetical protein GA0115251_130015 [Streptomyces sp. TverLS-915]